MRKLVISFPAAAAILAAGAAAYQADAQTTRGAADITTQAQNFTPIEKAACGPFWGRWCGPFHHRVCRIGPYGHRHCWCAPC